MGKTYQVKVKAPPRQGHEGFYSAQKFFPAGQVTPVELDGRQLKEVLNDDQNGFLMVEDAEGLRQQLQDDPDAGGGGPQQVTLSAEEASALEAFRRSRSQGASTGTFAPSPATAAQLQGGAGAPERQTASAGGSQVQDRGPDKQPGEKTTGAKARG